MARNHFADHYLVMYANVRDDRSKNGDTLPLCSTSRQESNDDRKGVARYGAGPFGDGSQIKSCSLDHHSHCQAGHRSLTDRIFAMPLGDQPFSPPRQVQLCSRSSQLPEGFRGDHNLVNMIARRALKRTEVEAHARRHDASQHHVSTACRASRTLEVSVDVVGQGRRFLHDASLEQAGAQHSQSSVSTYGEVAVMGASLHHRDMFRWPILNGF